MLSQTVALEPSPFSFWGCFGRFWNRDFLSAAARSNCLRCSFTAMPEPGSPAPVDRRVTVG